jgi:hypothetical protein
MVECGGGSCQMIAAQVCEGNRSGQPDSRAAELARRPRPLDAQDRTGALAYPRGAPPGRDPVSSLRAGASGPAGGGDAVVRLRPRPQFDGPVLLAMRPTR